MDVKIAFLNGTLKDEIYMSVPKGLIHDDGKVIATNEIQTMHCFKSYLQSKFQMTDLKEIRFFIGIKIERENGQLCLSKSAYIISVLNKFNMENCNAVKTP